MGQKNKIGLKEAEKRSISETGTSQPSHKRREAHKRGGDGRGRSSGRVARWGFIVSPEPLRCGGCLASGTFLLSSRNPLISFFLFPFFFSYFGMWLGTFFHLSIFFPVSFYISITKYIPSTEYLA